MTAVTPRCWTTDSSDRLTICDNFVRGSHDDSHGTTGHCTRVPEGGLCVAGGATLLLFKPAKVTLIYGCSLCVPRFLVPFAPASTLKHMAAASGFSGAVRLVGLDDHITPSQACIKPVKAAAGGGELPRCVASSLRASAFHSRFCRVAPPRGGRLRR